MRHDILLSRRSGLLGVRIWFGGNISCSHIGGYVFGLSNLNLKVSSNISERDAIHKEQQRHPHYSVPPLHYTISVRASSTRRAAACLASDFLLGSGEV
jgi:hypothetical protein